MYGQLKLSRLLDDFVQEIRESFGDRLKEVILYGSYARGDYEADSDVDVAIILDIPQGAETAYHDKLIDIVDDIDTKYDYEVLLSPILIRYATYEEWKEVLPFYKNVAHEGVKLSA